MPPASLYLLGRTLKEVGALDKAMSLLRGAQHEYPGDLWINDALAEFSATACEPPRWDDALRFSTVALALRPDLAPIRTSMANALLAKGAVQEALAEYAKGIEIWQKLAARYPDNGSYQLELAWAHSEIGRSLRRADRQREAERHIRDSAAIVEKLFFNSPTNVEYRQQLGDRHYDLLDILAANEQQKEIEKALPDLMKAIKLDSKNAAAWAIRGWAYIELHQYDKGLADTSKALDLDSKVAWFWNNRGVAYRCHGRAAPDLPSSFWRIAPYLASCLRRATRSALIPWPSPWATSTTMATQT
jgi:tetratricopeptide (TPR) repeat protein